MATSRLYGIAAPFSSSKEQYMRSIRGFSGAFALLLVAGGLSVSAQSWQVTKTLPIGGEGGWDYITADAATHRLFVTRTTHTMVIDADSGKTLGDIPGQKTAHGVAIVPRLNRGFISDGGGSGAIIIFDLKTYAVLGRLEAMPDADGIIYDPGTNLVLASAGDSNALITVKADVDPKSGKIDAPIMLEAARSSWRRTATERCTSIWKTRTWLPPLT